MTAGADIEAPEAVGFRVHLAGAAAFAGHTVSARLWVNRQPRSDYAVDRAIASDTPDELTLELVNPYGRAGFDLDAGAYQLQLFVDGSTRYDLAWTVAARPTEPLYQTMAGSFIDPLIADGYTCDPPATEGAETKYICSSIDADGTQLIVNATGDGQDRITTVVLGAITEEGGADVATAAPAFFNAMIRLLYPPDLAERAAAWIDEQGTAVNDIEIGGTTIRVFGADEHTRNLDIWSP